MGAGAPEVRRAQFRSWFSEQGWHDGKNLALDFAVVGASSRDLDARLQEALSRKPQVVLGPALGILPTLRRLDPRVPYVFYNYGADPIRAGVVESLRRPGGNVTGTTQKLIDLIPRIWQLLKEIRPNALRNGDLVTEEYLARG